ncbi:MAG TPA: Hsp20/alpha crystallin family protein, partial [Deinococcales bacterium]|nr:Hsp20/alpha crystallin family protein [Deinococcales bacterium]
MELQPWSPARDLDELREQVARLAAVGPSWTPSGDWYATDDELWLLVDLPGPMAEHVQVGFGLDEVIVSGRRREPEGAARLYGDRPQGEFERAFPFPEAVEEGSGRGQLAEGVLTVRLRKRNPTIDISTREG